MIRQTHRLGALLRLALLISLVASCSTQAPDLGRLYEGTLGSEVSQADTPTPLVLIPGALGSRLSDPRTGREVWPGSLAKVVLSDYRELALEIDPQSLQPRESSLLVSGLTDRAAGRDYYGAILRVLEEAGGYRPGEPGMPPGKGARRYYVFTYDWRQDNVHNVRKLDEFLTQLRRDYDDPGLQVDIVAHSMGGLIARYYARYGTRDVLDDNEFLVTNEGARYLRRLVLLGTPNLGSVEAFQTLMRGYPVGLRHIPAEVVASFPSTYQLLPHPINTWLVTADGRELKRDLFSQEFWRRFEISIFDPTVQKRLRSADAAQDPAVYGAYFERQIERARRFVWSLTVPAPESRLRIITFGGDCRLTPSRILVEEVDGQSHLRLAPDEVLRPEAGMDYARLMLEPGDGVVTKASLLARQALDPAIQRHRYIYFPLKYAFFLCEDHGQLTANVHFQDNLLHAVLSSDSRRMGPEAGIDRPQGGTP